MSALSEFSFTLLVPVVLWIRKVCTEDLYHHQEVVIYDVHWLCSLVQSNKEVVTSGAHWLCSLDQSNMEVATYDVHLLFSRSE